MSDRVEQLTDFVLSQDDDESDGKTSFTMSLGDKGLIYFDISLADEDDIETILNAIVSLASGDMATGIFELLMKHPLFGDLLTEKLLRLEIDLQTNDQSSPAILPSQTVL